jgi:branched-chain amino acid transport system ATP-binding protein
MPTPSAARRELAYGRRRLLEIALALASRPPRAAPRRARRRDSRGGEPRGAGNLAGLPADVTVLFIEHDMGLVFRYRRAHHVLVAGRVLAEGTPRGDRRERAVRAVYLGE